LGHVEPCSFGRIVMAFEEPAPPEQEMLSVAASINARTLR
jgi:hypothetical protein